ncbi:hypothetical protein [Bacillus sp. SM2101]|uniref:hypothetical protein n=1 Tax=Bacillus sp. SM2101 TaxID=2805366 RepID=UPI001BDF08C4|nr:hypothetical protein [Bacillus sp. SM2101]
MKHFFIMFFSILVLFLGGCMSDNTSSDGTINNLEKVNEQQVLVQKYEEELENAEDKISQLSEDVKYWRGTYETSNQVISNTITNLQQYIEHQLILIENEIGHVDLSRVLSIYDPEKVKEGSEVGTLTVKNIKIEKDDNKITKYQIDFNGEFHLKGSVSIDEGYGGYLFIVDPKYLNNIPHTLENLKKGLISFKIQNEDEFNEVLSENLSMGETLTINAIFKDFTSFYYAESHAADIATFIKLIDE